VAFNYAAAKRMFFDQRAVRDALDPEVRKRLSRFGSFVRTRSRSSIKKRKGASPPGKPPSAHGPELKKILFGYDRDAGSVVIGPVLAGSRSGAPETLERGGDATVKLKGKLVRAHYAPRPYMKPAFDTELQKTGNNFKNLIK
jgi:hypothetical protein